MGIINSKTFPGEVFTSICNECGVSLCWDITDSEYKKDKEFWDGWKCEQCDSNYKMKPKHYRVYSKWNY